MANAIVWIGKRAKAIQRAHPKMEWATARTKATAEWNSGKRSSVSGVRKKAHKKKAAPKRRAVGAVKKRSRPAARKIARRAARPAARSKPSIMGAVQHLKAAKNLYEDQYGILATKLLSARTKTEKNKISKQMAELKATIRKIDKK